jgi:hypothetical protein
MGVRTFNGRFITYSGKVLKTSGIVSFLVNGNQFTSASFSFSSASSVLIDFSDGTGYHQFDANTSNSLRIAFQLVSTSTFYAYTYQDGKSSSYVRTIKVIILEKVKLTQLQLVGFAASGSLTGVANQTLKLSFSEYTNLGIFVLTGNYLLDIDDSYLSNTSIKTLNFGTLTFNMGSKYYGVIPIVLLTNKTYTSFSYTTPLGGVDFATSNLDKFVNLKSTLTTLGLNTCSLGDTNGSNGALPDNFNQLANLTSLSLIRNNYTTIPPQVNTIPSLQIFGCGSVNLTSWGDLSALVNLTNFTMDECRNMPAYCPAYVTNFTKLRVLRFATFSKGGAGGDASSNPARLDALVSSVYSIWNINAPKTGSNNIQYRGLQIYLAATEALTSSDAPSGTYQQPSGYLQGSNNGTPATSREMIWVLVNQYACTVIYNNS